MFKELMNLAYKRSAPQAFGFYIVYVILTLLTAALLGSLLGLSGLVQGFQAGVRVGAIVAIIATLVVAFWVLYAKKLLGNVAYIIIALLAGGLSVLGGAILGFIAVAYLTTR